MPALFSLLAHCPFRRSMLKETYLLARLPARNFLSASEEIMKQNDLPIINGMTWSEFVNHVEGFHGYAAPGVLVGGIMVEMAKAELDKLNDGKRVLFDVIAESYSCLPDAVQLLTACTVGNCWLKVLDLSRYALSMYDKHTGHGVRVYIDAEKLKAFPNFYEWFMNLKDKHEQDENQLREEIRLGTEKACSIQIVDIPEKWRIKTKKGKVDLCPVCGEPYPLRDGAICKGCQGEGPIAPFSGGRVEAPALRSVPVEEAVGKKILHDMTQIIPGESKGRAFKAGQTISAGDLCRLHAMGRKNVFLRDELPDSAEWVHENDVAMAFAKAMSGEGVTHDAEAKEGKVQMSAAAPGLLMVDEDRLEAFNLVPGVMCATRHGYSVVKEGDALAGTRAIPLYLPRSSFLAATAVLEKGPIFNILPLRKAKVGILVTGTEVFRGLVEDKFAPIIRNKVEPYGCTVVHSEIVPDELEPIKRGVANCLAAGADLIVTTAGLSVDPDDVTRKALLEAGLEGDTFGFPILPGAMSLVGRIKTAQILSVPACALYHKITAADLLLPRLLAGLNITRRDAAKLGHGGLCLNCKACTFPQCTLGR